MGKVERAKFADAIHEYLIEQVQESGNEGVNSTSQKFRLAFNHPCKTLHVVVRQSKYTSGNKFMAWNPLDARDMQVQATKRIAMAWGTVTNGLLVCDTAVDAGLQAAVNAAKVAAIDISGSATQVADADSLICLGPLLDMRYVSMTAAELTTLASTATRATTGDGAATSDIVVNDWTNFATFIDRSVNPVKEMLITLNNQDRLSKRDGLYYNYVQARQCFKVTPSAGLNSYSFAINPFDLQPSGSVNMSRIDNAFVHLDFITQAQVNTQGTNNLVSVNVHGSASADILALSYNVFRVIGGMGGMGFSA